MKYLLLFLLSPLVLFSMNQSEQLTKAKKGLELFHRLLKLEVPHNFLNSNQLIFFDMGKNELVLFLYNKKTDHLAKAQLYFEDASNPLATTEEILPLAKYAAITTIKLNGNDHLLKYYKTTAPN